MDNNFHGVCGGRVRLEVFCSNHSRNSFLIGHVLDISEESFKAL